jgi:hypothetical protein
MHERHTIHSPIFSVCLATSSLLERRRNDMISSLINPCAKRCAQTLGGIGSPIA